MQFAKCTAFSAVEFVIDNAVKASGPEKLGWLMMRKFQMQAADGHFNLSRSFVGVET
jgi:hypothetical protein